MLYLLALLRHELAKLTEPGNTPLGPPEFMQRYLCDLKRRIGDIETELHIVDPHAALDCSSSRG